MSERETKEQRNARVQDRYDELMGEGKHGHYETLFRVVREEIDRAGLTITDAALPPSGAEPFGWWDDQTQQFYKVKVPLLRSPEVWPLYRTAPPNPVCDGNHAAPACAAPECWQRPSPVAPEPTPEGMCRAALLWVLWHHQGGSSDVGQPIRFALGMGAHEPLSVEQVEAAKSYGVWAKKWPPDSPGAERP